MSPAALGAIEESDAFGSPQSFREMLVQEWHDSDFVAVGSRLGVQESADG